jgi:hypothetical protein
VQTKLGMEEASGSMVDLRNHSMVVVWVAYCRNRAVVGVACCRHQADTVVGVACCTHSEACSATDYHRAVTVVAPLHQWA